jgi:hypothetical protein
MFGAQDDSLDWLVREHGERVTALGIDAHGHVRGAVLIDNGRDATPVRRIINGERIIDRMALLDPQRPLRNLC